MVDLFKTPPSKWSKKGARCQKKSKKARVGRPEMCSTTLAEQQIRALDAQTETLRESTENVKDLMKLLEKAQKRNKKLCEALKLSLGVQGSAVRKVVREAEATRMQVNANPQHSHA